MRIARCEVHGLHGQRERCYVCDRPCDQVEMIPPEIAAKIRALCEYETSDDSGPSGTYGFGAEPVNLALDVLALLNDDGLSIEGMIVTDKVKVS